MNGGVISDLGEADNNTAAYDTDPSLDQGEVFDEYVFNQNIAA